MYWSNDAGTYVNHVFVEEKYPEDWDTTSPNYAPAITAVKALAATAEPNERTFNVVEDYMKFLRKDDGYDLYYASELVWRTNDQGTTSEEALAWFERALAHVQQS